MEFHPVGIARRVKVEKTVRDRRTDSSSDSRVLAANSESDAVVLAAGSSVVTVCTV